MKNTIYGIAGVILLVAAFLVGKSFGTASNNVGASAVGSTFSSAKEFAITWSLSSSSGTTTSILNGTGNDLYVKSSQVMCTGVGTSLTAYTGTGLANLTFTAATSSTANPASLTNTNYIFNSNISTSTVNVYVSSSTEGVITGTSRIWLAGSYMTYSTNATNTATCTIGQSVLGS